MSHVDTRFKLHSIHSMHSSWKTRESPKIESGPNYTTALYAFVKATLRLGLRAPLVSRNNPDDDQPFRYELSEPYWWNEQRYFSSLEKRVDFSCKDFLSGENSESREWRHDSDKITTNKLEWWMILKISLRAKAGVPKILEKEKLRLHSLYFTQNTLMLTETRGQFSDLHSIFRLRALRYWKAAWWR